MGALVIEEKSKQSFDNFQKNVIAEVKGNSIV